MITFFQSRARDSSDLWGEDLDPSNFKLIGYKSHEAVKGTDSANINIS
jgi:hypothetical protein